MVATLVSNNPVFFQ